MLTIRDDLYKEVQLWVYDNNGFFKWYGFANELQKDEIEQKGFHYTEVALTIGYVKPKFTGDEWIEGATREEIAQWEREEQESQINQKSFTEIRLNQIESALEVLATQTAKNTLLNGGI